MKHRTKQTCAVVLGAMVVLGLLAGCGQQVDIETPPAANTPVQTDEIATESAVPRELITYVRFGTGYVPVSYSIDNVQQLTGGCGCDEKHAAYDCGRWFEWTQTVFAKTEHAPQADEIKSIDAAEMFSGDSVQSGQMDMSGIFSSVASNGDWDFFPSKVLYTEYSLDNQPDHAEWNDFFQFILTSSQHQTPIIYTDSWKFDWNGTQTALVNVSNLIRASDAGAAANPPPGSHTAVYSMSVLFMEGSAPRVLAWYGLREDEGPFALPSGTIGNEPLTAEINRSYLPPAEGDMEYQGHLQEISAVQYDENGSLIICPVFHCGEPPLPTRFVMLLCDIDGDGETELVLFMLGSIYNPILVYKTVNGEPTEVFRLPTGA
jgi:predicted small lipoprotein YifL